MSTPSPTDPSPLPSATAVTAVTGLSAVLGYLATLAAAKFGLPADVVGGVISLVATGLTALWHRFVPASSK